RQTFVFLLMPPQPPSSTLFPYTTLFRSLLQHRRSSWEANDNLAAQEEDRPMKRIAAVLALLLPLVALAQTGVKVKMFPGAAAMPAMAAAAQGLFAHHGLKVELLFTANSDEQ